MEETFVALIAVAVVVVIVLAILLKVLAKFPIVNFIFQCGAAIATIVIAFAMPPSQGKLTWEWAITQGLVLFLFNISWAAIVAFDTEDYVSTTAHRNWEGDVHFSSKLESRSMFWSTLGFGLAVAAITVGLNYAIFQTNAIAIGVIGCGLLLYTVVPFVKKILPYARSKRNGHYYDD